MRAHKYYTVLFQALIPADRPLDIQPFFFFLSTNDPAGQGHTCCPNDGSAATSSTRRIFHGTNLRSTS